jgi:hypothetical protein
MARSAPALFLVLALGAPACSKSSSDAQRDTTAEILAWQDFNTKAAGRDAIRLRDGTCLDARRAPSPWTSVSQVDPLNPGLVIAAPGKTVGIAPYELGMNWDGRQYDGRVWVDISGWSRPPRDEIAPWMVASPSRLDELIEGTPERPDFKRLPLWQGRKTLEAFPGAYVDRRRLTQCRDYGPDIKLVWCDVVSRDEQFAYSVKLSASNVPKLPEALTTITQAVEQTRGSCPADSAASATTAKGVSRSE